MNGLLTEREWRKQASRQKKSRPGWWGAQYVLPEAKKGLKHDRSFLLFLLIVSFTAAALLPTLAPRRQADAFTELPACESPSAHVPRQVSSICYGLPPIAYRTQTFTRDQLLRGSLLLLDHAHTLPPDAPPPNTFSIASYGRGMVPVQSLQLQSGQRTINALQELFQALRLQGVSDLAVTQATRSRAQQAAQKRLLMRSQMRQLPPDAAREATQTALICEAGEELLQEYTVELRFMKERQADSRPLEATANGQKLLQTAWRYGFVRTHPQADDASAYLFRYVGKAHATAMTYLDLSLPAYLDWLHQKGSLAIEQGGELRYLILCAPLTGTHTALSLPAEAICEVSADNTGYAIAACTF